MGCQSTKQPGATPDDRLKVAIQYAHMMKEEKILEALELVGPDVTWQPFSGPPVTGRDRLKTYFEENRQRGIKRQGVSHWWMEGEPSADGKSYTAKRHVSYEKPNSTPFRALQTMEVENGLITKAVVEAATWEANLEPKELLRRFASLRAQNRNRDAVKCLAQDCEWTPFNCLQIFMPPDELKDQVLTGPEKIETILDMQRAQNVVREVKSDWEEGDVGMLGESIPRAIGKVFFRKLVIKGGGGGAFSQPFVQVAQVHDGQIVSMLHKEE